MKVNLKKGFRHKTTDLNPLNLGSCSFESALGYHCFKTETILIYV